MPVLQVFVPSGPEVEERLRAAAAAVSVALGLPDDGVVAVHVPTGLTVHPGHRSPLWPVVVVHGSPRDPEAMDRALTALRELAAAWTDDGEPWVTWAG